MACTILCGSIATHYYGWDIRKGSTKEIAAVAFAFFLEIATACGVTIASLSYFTTQNIMPNDLVASLSFILGMANLSFTALRFYPAYQALAAEELSDSD